jgi:acetolactate synthase I/II/III large subunit
MSTTVDVVVEVLKREGIDRIFGIPGGGSTTELLDAAKRAGIEPVLCCHEGSAALIASVYGEIKETPGVCFSIMGPGAAHMATGVAYAFLERVPLLAFTECHPPANRGFITTQKIDHKTFFAAITKNHFTVTAVDAQQIVEKSLLCAKEERPGPVHLDLPNKEMANESTYQVRERGMLRLSRFAPRDSNALREIIGRVGQAHAPLIVAGIEAKRAKAMERLAALAEKWNVPVMVSVKGRGAFDERHPLYGGVFLGIHSKGTFEEAVVGKSDLLLFVGVDGIELLPRPWALRQPVIHMGYRPNVDYVYPSALEVVGDIQRILEILAQHALQPTLWDRGFLEEFRKGMKETLCSSGEELPAHHIVQSTRERLPSDGILTTDVGAFNALVHYLWQVREPKTYFTSKGLSTMGIALPAAIGAQLALPSRRVVCFTGDGGLLMRLQDLEMCSRLGLPIIIVVFSDSGLGLIRVKQKSKGYDVAGVELKNPDFDLLARAFGGIGFRAETKAEFDRAFEEAMKSRKLCLIEAVMDPRTYGDHLKWVRG